MDMAISFGSRVLALGVALVTVWTSPMQGQASPSSSDLPLTIPAAPARTLSAPPPLNAQQLAGKGLFLQNCAICHLPDRNNPKNTDDPGTTVGPVLNGLFRRNPAPREEVIRVFIQRGTQKMPGFQYGLQPAEIDSVIAYLKTL
jgi:mono/diheme cytochrome c family protein